MLAESRFMPDTASKPSTSGVAFLRVEGVRVLYGKREALASVSLEAPAGSVTLLTGRNGAGKSTLLKAVFGAVKATEGRISLAGRDVTGSRPHENALRGIAYLAQGGAVFPELTVSENLEVARLYLGDSAQNPAGSAPELTENGGNGKAGPALFPALRGLVNRPAGLLSGGERQMLALAMCLSRQPALLLLDEPTAGLAGEIARQVLEYVRKACDATGCAALLAEQNVAEARRIADVEYALAAGRIVSTVRLRQPGGNVL